MSLLELIEGQVTEAQTEQQQAARAAPGDILTILSDPTPEGRRSTAYTRLAGFLRARGLGAEMIAGVLSAANRATATGLPEGEIESIARSVMRYAPRAENRVPTTADILTVDEAREHWAAAARHASIVTGFPHFDHAFPIFAPGEVLTVAGRAGVGKTTLAIALGARLARALGGHGLMCSLEMNAGSLYFRLAAIAESEDRRSEQTAHQVAEALRCSDLAGRIRERYGNLLIVDKDALTIEQIETYWQLAREKAGAAVPVCIVDYLGYVNDTQAGSTYERTSRIAKAVKGLAKRQDGRVMLLCQTSRDGEDGTVPVKLNHLRDSGSIEESADHLLGMWQDKGDAARIHCEVLKSRHAPKGYRFDFVKTGLALSDADYEETRTKAKEF